MSEHLRHTWGVMRSSIIHRSAALAGLTLILLVTVGCEQVFPKRTAGEKLYRKHCADCHSADGSGNTIGYMGNNLANLLDNSWKHGGDHSSMQFTLRDGLVFRHPSYDELSGKELQQIVSHVLALRGETSH